MHAPAFELYAGDGKAVRAACAEDRLGDLRAGRITPYFAIFPRPFQPSDILLIEKATAAITGTSEPLEIDRVEVDGGLFVDRIATSWVESVAALGVGHAPTLEAEWARAYQNQEGALPEWSQSNRTALMVQLISVCREAKDRRLDLLMVWLF